MDKILKIIDFIQSNGAGQFISIVQTLFDLLMYYITGGQEKINSLIEAGKKYRETKDTSILDNLINK